METNQLVNSAYVATRFKSVAVDGITIFYREAGPANAPVILLLHGFPSSSHMYRQLIDDLSGKYRVIAPDYPGFGLSSCPSPQEFSYTFDNLAKVMEKFVDALNITSFSLYMQDYGGPIGFRLASQRPSSVQALIIQNANAYEQGLSPAVKQMWQIEKEKGAAALQEIINHMLTLEGIRENYIHQPDMTSKISPEAYLMDFYFLDQPGRREIQSVLLLNYKTNFTQYHHWHHYFKKFQPPALVVWGKYDPIFITPGAKAYLTHLPKAEVHILEGGHFLLEEQHQAVAILIDQFLDKHKIK